jgi:hypothetical protein
MRSVARLPEVCVARDVARLEELELTAAELHDGKRPLRMPLKLCRRRGIPLHHERAKRVGGRVALGVIDEVTRARDRLGNATAALLGGGHRRHWHAAAARAEEEREAQVRSAQQPPRIGHEQLGATLSSDRMRPRGVLETPRGTATP